MEMKHNYIQENFQIFGVMSLIYGVLFCIAFFQNWSGITSPIMSIITIIYFSFCFQKLEISVIKDRWFYFAAIFCLGLSNMLTNSWILIFLNYCGLILLICIYLIQHFYETGSWNFSKYSGALLQTIFGAIGNLYMPFQSLGRLVKKYQKNKASKAPFVWIGLAISIPLMVIICSLLLSADVVFRSLTENLFLHFFENINFANIIIVLILFTISLIGSYGLLSELTKNNLKTDTADKKTWDPVIAITFTSVLTVTYVLFCAIQVMYLFTGSLSLPEGYTYAEYAREGFFQLLFVCLINLVLVLICIGRFKESSILKLLLTAICICTYVMIASSTMRMILYISSYYLTFTRVFVLVALFVLLLCLTGVLLSIYRPEFPLFRFMMVVVTICYVVFSLSKPDSYIAAYNLQAATEETDLYYIYNSLSLDAVPAMEKAGVFEKLQRESTINWHQEDRYYSDGAENKIAEVNHFYHQMNLRTFNVSVYRAGKIIETYAAK